MQQPERVIDVVGTTDEESARVRLLFRMGAARFNARWRFSDSERPDLLLLDPATPLGAAAREVSLQLRHTFITLVDVGTEDGADWALRRPLKLDAMVRMVNLLCPPPLEKPAAAPSVNLVSQGENFFDLDLGDSLAKQFDDGLPDVKPAQIVRGQGAHDVDGLFRRDPMANTPEMLIPHRLGANTSVEFTEAPTLRTQARLDEIAERIGAREVEIAPNIDPRLRRSALEDTSSFPLLDYLTKPILGGPSRIEMGGLPPLVLDPVNEAYHADVDLPALELYCLQELSRSSFKALTSTELAQVRVKIPAKPWLRLRWQVRYLTAEGKLSSQLDPGGKFKLQRPIELARDYPTAYRVSSAMLREFLPLHEIAKVAKVGMTEVINVVNAYDSVNLLDAQLRERFR
jgi:hypothetical protein